MDLKNLQPIIADIMLRLYMNSWLIDKLKETFIFPPIKTNLPDQQSQEKYVFLDVQEKTVFLARFTAWVSFECTLLELLAQNVISAIGEIESEIPQEFREDLLDLDKELVKMDSILTNLRIRLAQEGLLVNGIENVLGLYSKEVDNLKLFLEQIKFKPRTKKSRTL